MNTSSIVPCPSYESLPSILIVSATRIDGPTGICRIQETLLLPEREPGTVLRDLPNNFISNRSGVWGYSKTKSPRPHPGPHVQGSTTTTAGRPDPLCTLPKEAWRGSQGPVGRKRGVTRRPLLVDVNSKHRGTSKDNSRMTLDKGRYQVSVDRGCCPRPQLPAGQNFSV